MNNLSRSITLLAFTFLVFFSSCKKDDASPNTPAGTQTLSFNLNGTSSTISDLNSNAYITGSPVGGAVFNITALTAAAENLSISCTTKVGTYKVGSTASGTSIAVIKGATRTICSSGTIDLTLVDTDNKRIAGTFNGTGPGITVTNGSFAMTYK